MTLSSSRKTEEKNVSRPIITNIQKEKKTSTFNSVTLIKDRSSEIYFPSYLIIIILFIKV